MTDQQRQWAVESLGRGVFLFRWHPGFYLSCFIVGNRGVTAVAFRAGGGQMPRPNEDGVAMTERVRIEVTQAAADAIADRYGSWRGFAAWAPQTADRILSYLITGN
ncbi:MAG: hypothetical protein ACKOGN_08385 [Gammaproteobacteria bacterium]|jgi:hypothetical protein